MEFPESINKLFEWGSANLISDNIDDLKKGWVYKNPPKNELGVWDSDFVILEKKSREGIVFRIKIKDL